VRGASKIALSLGVSSLVVGLTIVAFGTRDQREEAEREENCVSQHAAILSQSRSGGTRRRPPGGAISARMHRP